MSIECKHGQLDRSCEICELEKEVEALRKELGEERRRRMMFESMLIAERNYNESIGTW